MYIHVYVQYICKCMSIQIEHGLPLIAIAAADRAQPLALRTHVPHQRTRLLCFADLSTSHSMGSFEFAMLSCF